MLPKFDCFSDPATIGPQWTRWLNSFEVYADGKGLIINETTTAATKQRRRAMLLHLAGPDVQEIFTTLTDTGNATDYARAVDVLNAYFVPQVNSAFARQTFHQITQKPGETVQQFATRLKKAAKDCDFGTDADNQIRDAVLNKCASTYIKRKLLEEGQGLNLKRTLEIAEQCEKIETQLAALSAKGEEPESINRVNERGTNTSTSTHGRSQTKDQTCYRCGSKGHFGRDPQCPAKGKTCRKCGGRDHFEKVCKTKSYAHQVGKGPSDPQHDYAFSINEGEQSEMITVQVGGVDLKMLIDSGANSNIVDEGTWEQLKAKGVKCESQAASPDKKLYPYASNQPLPVKGSFKCTVAVCDRSTRAEFLVIKGRGMSLLGKVTATELGVLKVGINIALVTTKAHDLKLQYPEVFEGVGKLKDKQISLDIDPTVKPVAQPYRRIPFNLREKVQDKTTELLELGIVEPVEGPAPWVNPVVIVPKNNGEIRLCNDMRQANQAIMRRRYPIPTVDDVLHTMNGSKVFSKLDLKWGYHQLELSPESREITTFATPDGLFRYKRLLFGVCSASEQYQHEIASVLAGIEGAENISDDIVVHGPDTETRDKRLHQTIRRLQECGLTLNAEKCLFNMDRLVFMGMLLSEKGIGPTEDRVKAVLEAKEPENATDIRSFLGLANYSSRFIPHFATLSEPLRRLTRKETPFEFGPEQRKSFESLKQKMAEACTLAYFAKTAPTKVITDASPVGLGAVLVQEQGGAWTPVCYASRSLTVCEQKYSQTEKEALGVVWACERFHVYLYGMKFVVETDHKPLEVIYGPRSRPCARIERWVLRLQPYDFSVVHRPGLGNIADPLSRLLHREVKPDNHQQCAEKYVRFVAMNATPTALTTREIEEASAVDEELIEVRRAIATGQFEKSKQYMAVAGELCVIGQLVLRGTRIVIPQKLHPRTLALAHEGHLGVVGTKQNLRTKVWWPGMDRAADRHCRTCHGCQLVARPDPPEPIRSTTLPDGPWQDLAVDLMGPLPFGHSLLVIVDYYSRFYEVEVMQSTTAEKVIDRLAPSSLTMVHSSNQVNLENIVNSKA